MTKKEEQLEIGRSTADLVRTHLPGMTDYNGRTFWEVVNFIAHALQGEESLLFSGTVEGEEVEFACFTATRVLVGKGNPGADSLAVTIISRSALQKVDVLSAPDVIEGADWNKRYLGSYRLAYAGGVTFTLPVNLERRMPDPRKLDELVPGLMADLAK